MDENSRGSNDLPEEPPPIDISDAQSADGIALSRIPRILGNDDEESEETLNSMARYVAEGDHMGSAPDPTASDVLYRFKRALEKGYVPAEVADRVAERLVKDHGDEMTVDERERVHWLGAEAIIMLVDSYDHDEPEIRNARPFEDEDLSTVDYVKLSDTEERELFREKARRIRADRGN